MAAPTTAIARFGMIIGAILCLSQCQHPEKSVASAGAEKVILIGWDGADWRIARDLIERGEMPHLARLVAEGTSAELETLRPTVSPMIWTSIATGVSPAVHGIDGFWTEAAVVDRGAPEHITDQLEALGYIDGAQPNMRLYESTDRRFDALWNRVEAAGLRASIIGWWITYPAEPLSGGMVSERFFLNRVQLDLESGGSTVAGEAGLVHPEDELSALDALRVRPRDITPERLARFISVVEGEDDASLATESSVEQLRMVIAKDEMTSRVAARFLERDAELVAVYFHGADIASHYFWKHRFPDEWNWVHPDRPVPEDDLARFGGTVDAYYRYLDEQLGSILRAVGDDVTVVLCSDHGFILETQHAVTNVSGVHTKAAPPGMFVAWGRGIRRGVTLDSAHVYDVAPTVLTLLGIPFDELEGSVLEKALAPR